MTGSVYTLSRALWPSIDTFKLYLSVKSACSYTVNQNIFNSFNVLPMSSYSLPSMKGVLHLLAFVFDTLSPA